MSFMASYLALGLTVAASWRPGASQGSSDEPRVGVLLPSCIFNNTFFNVSISVDWWSVSNTFVSHSLGTTVSPAGYRWVYASCYQNARLGPATATAYAAGSPFFDVVPTSCNASSVTGNSSLLFTLRLKDLQQSLLKLNSMTHRLTYNDSSSNYRTIDTPISGITICSSTMATETTIKYHSKTQDSRKSSPSADVTPMPKGTMDTDMTIKSHSKTQDSRKSSPSADVTPMPKGVTLKGRTPKEHWMTKASKNSSPSPDVDTRVEVYKTTLTVLAFGAGTGIFFVATFILRTFTLVLCRLNCQLDDSPVGSSEDICHDTDSTPISQSVTPLEISLRLDRLLNIEEIL